MQPQTMMNEREKKQKGYFQNTKGLLPQGRTPTFTTKKGNGGKKIQKVCEERKKTNTQ